MERTKLPLEPKIGSVPEDGEKFASWYGPHGYYRRTDTFTSPFLTDTMRNQFFDKDEMVNNLMISSKLKETNKSHVEVKTMDKSKAKTKLLLGKTILSDDFVDHEKSIHILRSSGSEENFKSSFQKQLQGSTNTQELSENSSLPIHRIPFVVEDCMPDIPNYVTKKFVELSKYSSQRDDISWKEFKSLIQKVIASVEYDFYKKSETPPLVKLMTKPRLIDKNLGSMGEINSTYRDSFNKSIEFDFKPTNEFHFHNTHSEDDPHMKLNKAARILCAGTTKGTFQIPGYRGHIPANVRNEKKLEHSLGKEAHPIVNNLRLTQRGMGCVLGYTGHIPHVPRGSHTERTTACDPRTTNGAAFGATRLML